MIHDAVKTLLLANGENLYIEGSRCATVRGENTLLHALMLLSTSGFGEIPVVNSDQQLVGVVSMPMIINGIRDEVQYCWDDLDSKKVSEVMKHDVGKVQEPVELEDVLHELVDHNFACLVDDQGVFKGIVTRKNLLTRVNFMAHEMGEFYTLTPKERMEGLKD